MSKYTCPVCQEAVPRDLIVFLDHTNQHIFAKIKEKHPDWATPEGICPKCVEYYMKQMQR